ncbi:MAG TPA: hypothetical protein VGF50_07660 [Caulobacteraceae bacterium]
MSVRKWNRNLSPTENMRASFKQPVVRLNTYSAIAWSLLWILASFLAAIDFDEPTALTYFLAGPAIAFVVMALGTYVGLPRTAFGRNMIDFEAESAASGGPLQWGVTVLYFIAWLPFVRSSDPHWVAATSWIATPVAAVAGFQAGIGLLTFAGRSR